MGRDASIVVQQVKFTYNGTYICLVKNPPDVHGAVGVIRLRVVTTGQQGALPNISHRHPSSRTELRSTITEVEDRLQLQCTVTVTQVAFTFLY